MLNRGQDPCRYYRLSPFALIFLYPVPCFKFHVLNLISDRMLNQKKDKRNFFADVYEVVKLIPPGRVTSYGAVAKYLGSAGSARIVGWAMLNAHTLSDRIPTHRVVNRQGLLTGRQHFRSPTEMQERLEAEGIPVQDDQIRNFEHYFWDPAKELL